MIESLIVKKVAPGLFRYFFAITAPSDSRLSGLLSVRVYPKWFRFFGTTNQFRLDLKPGQRSTFTVECNFLFKQPYFAYKTGKVKGGGKVSNKREDLT